MVTRRQGFRVVLVSAILCVWFASFAWANKSAVSLEAPAEAKRGEVVEIIITVRHNGNNIFHYTNWVSLKINGQEVQRWEYSMFSRPESEDFTLKYRQTVDGSMDIQAQANCSRHGSDNTAEATISTR